MKTLNPTLTKVDKTMLKNKKKEESKMRKKKITTIMSMITILFIFSSISYAGDFSSHAWETAHNNLRYWHGAGKLKWDYGLAAQAKIDADNWDGYHPHPQQNYKPVDLEYIQKNPSYSAEDVVASWYAEENAYKANSNGYTTEPDMTYFYIFGHFTQVVWKSATKVGCAVGTGGTVCNYDKGNEGGAAGFKQNVGYNFFRLWRALFLRIFFKVKMVTIP